jgi:predicted Co/Zn/Cd cation transporter (cation efflux family)
MDADRDPRTTPASRVLDEALRLGPCSASQTLLLTLDPSSLTPRDAVAFAEAAERITAWWASMTFDALVAATGRDRRIDEFLVTDSRDDGDHLIRIEDSAREEVSAALRWSPSTAQHRMDVSCVRQSGVRIPVSVSR